jgi:hypothetical protein
VMVDFHIVLLNKTVGRYKSLGNILNIFYFHKTLLFNGLILPVITLISHPFKQLYIKIFLAHGCID